MILNLSYKSDQNHLIEKNITLSLPQVGNSLQVFSVLQLVSAQQLCMNKLIRN